MAYDITKRLNKKMFVDAKKTLNDLKRKPKFKKDEFESWPEYIRRKRREAREAILMKRVPDRHCPICKRTFIKSRQWVIIAEDRLSTIVGPLDQLKTLKEHLICCRSCWKKFFYRK